MQDIKDRNIFYINGFVFIILVLISIFSALYFVSFSRYFLQNPFFSVLLVIIFIICSSGFVIINPNEALVLTFLGNYIGTIRTSGFIFTVPFTIMARIPVKLNNFVSQTLKVNDSDGNPIEIGAVIVWRITSPAKAKFNIDDYYAFIVNQTDIALRSIAAIYPYDSKDKPSLRGHIDEVAQKLKNELQDKLSIAGIIIEEARLSNLAYATEVASSMLKKQQAIAILNAREYLISNTLSIIDNVLDHFENKSHIKISDDKKADIINNLLVVMTSDKESTPVISIN